MSRTTTPSRNDSIQEIDTSTIDSLDTGDIILFSPTHTSGFLSILDWVIRRATHSDYSHVAMVLKDPTFVHGSLKGLYIWESGFEGLPDPQDNKTKLGVQITPLYEALQASGRKSVFVRRLTKGRDRINNTLLSKIHDVVYGKPYDTVITDWVGALFKKDMMPQKTDRFWCSALVCYFMVQLGFIKDSTDWSIVRPCDLSSGFQTLDWLPECNYSDDELIY